MKALLLLSLLITLSFAYDRGLADKKAISAFNVTWVPQIRNNLPTSPTVREFHSFTYIKNATSEIDARAVLFGGVTYNNITYNLGDTWIIEFPNETWIHVPSINGSAPDARAYHSACAHQGKVVVFGGKNESSRFFDDVWRFDLQTRTWSKDEFESKVNIQGRASHSSAIVKNKMFVFGGYVASKNKLTNDLWSYHLEERTWTEIFADGVQKMAARQGATLTSINGELGQSMILFGGYTGTGGFNDLWQYFEFQSKWVMINDDKDKSAPPGRTAHTAVGGRLGNSSSEVVIYGGFYVEAGAIPYYSDVWSLNVTGSVGAWKNLVPEGLADGPGRRGGHATVHAKNRSYTFGGYVMYGGFYNDLWMLQYEF